MERNILLKIEYDGTNFSGWQRQPGRRTVQGELEAALSKVCAMDVKLNGCSRTDAGVHALGQCASFKGDFGIPTEKIKIVVNNLLSGGMNGALKGGDVRILSVEEMPEDFHARFDSKGKTYRYLINNHEEISVFDRNRYYHVNRPLNIKAMREGSKYIEGTHDFLSFQAAGGNERETTVRTVKKVDILENKGIIEIQVTGDGFLYNMVRIIAGTLVEVGLGKKKSEDVKKIIEAKDRRLAGHTAPAAGLYLAKIYYTRKI